MMKHLLTAILILVTGLSLRAQESAPFPLYPVPEAYYLKSNPTLPHKVDNSTLPFFPPVFNQFGYSCNQASSVGYVFTYEINRARREVADAPERLYSPGFTWNLTNSSNSGIGVSYFDSYEIVKAAGNPNSIDYPYYHTHTGIWMSGYDRYYRAMQNRILVNYSIPVGTPEGLRIFKHYLHDHLDGSAEGGIASFQISSDGIIMDFGRDPETNQTVPIIRSYGVYVGHAMTFVGYNDSIRVDLNNDGLFTNDLDINNDGVVDMRDWEVGALLAVNSWGDSWGKEGKSYVLYSVLARQGYQGGIWNRSVQVCKVLEEYHPQLTMRVVMRHESREKFRILAGCSTNPEDTQPTHWINVPLFKFQGGDNPLQDVENHSDPDRFEFGLDLSELLTWLNPGQPARFFLVVEEDDPHNEAAGRVDEISIIHYGEDTTEIVGDQRDTPIQNNTQTYISVVRSVDFDPVTVDPPLNNQCSPGEPFSVQLTASGGKAPYRWELVKDYTQEPFVCQYEQILGDTLSDIDEEIEFTPIELPFDFPFYGETYRSLVVDINGSIHFDNEYDGYPYVVDDELVYRSGKSITPLGADIQVNTDGDHLVVQLTDSVALFQWNASVYTGFKVYPVKVMACLYPNGVIEFLYGDRGIPPEGDYPWISGISNGDGRLYKYSQIHETRITFEDYGVRFKPLDYPADLRLTDDGLLTGRAQLDNHIWKIQVRATDRYSQTAYGIVPVTTIDWEQTDLLIQNYPNPFKQITTIGLLLGQATDVTLEIFDIRGRRVRQLANHTLPAGEHLFNWNARDEENHDVLPGLYFYRLRTPQGIESGKMILIK